MISVLLAVRNGEKTIVRCLESLASQTVLPKQIVIVNDCSTDHTREIILDFFAKNCFLDYIIVDNLVAVGLAASLNIGLEKVNQRFCARIDADDYCMPDRFAIQLDFLVKNPQIDLVGSGIFLVNEDKVFGEMIPPDDHKKIIKNLYRGIPVHHPTWMINSAVIKSLGYNEKYRRAQDQEFLLRFCHTYKLFNIQKSLVGYSVGSYSGRLIKDLSSRYYLCKAQLEHELPLGYVFFYFILAVLSFTIKATIRNLRFKFRAI